MKKHHDLIAEVIFFILGLRLFSFEPSFVLRVPLTYLLLAVLGVRWLWYHFHTPGKKFFYSAKIGIILFFSTIMVLAIYGPLMQAKWGPIDDHEIMNYLGQEGQLTLNRLPRLIQQSEAAKPGITLRYRPVYQLLRLGESAVWGNHPGSWYTTRIVIFIISLSILWFLVSPLLGIAGGGLFTFYVMSFDYWKDIWARLGPSEAYAVLGLAIYALAFFFLWQKKILSAAKEKYWWFLFCLGGVLAIGSKENFIFLIIPTIILSLRFFFLKKLSLRRLLGLLAVILFAVFVYGAVMVATSKAGNLDVYSQSTTLVSRATLLITSLKTQQSKYLLILLAAVGVLMVGYLKLIAKDKEMLVQTIRYVGILVLLWALFVFHFVFYSGNIPSHSRYDFPALLFVPGLLLANFWYLTWLLKEIRIPMSIQKGINGSFLVGFCVLTVMHGFVGTQVVVAQTVKGTQAFTNRIGEIAQVLQKDPGAVVVMESGNVWDYEPIYSNRIFLQAYKVTNPFMLRVVDYSPETVHPGLEKELAASLIKLSQNGSDVIEPLEQLPTYKGHCYSLRLSGTAPALCPEL